MSPEKRSPETLSALLEEVLRRAPHDVRQRDSWVFAYGSMLEEPPFEAVERRVGVIEGHHRSFCLSDPSLRGTPDKPGLTLGLMPGGRCVGLTWRLHHLRARDDIARFWPAEMELHLYRAEWRPVDLGAGAAVPALVLLADSQSPLLQPRLSREQIIARLSASSGSKGPNSDYLFEVACALDRAGIPDPELDGLAQDLRRIQSAHAAGGRR